MSKFSKLKGEDFKSAILNILDNAEDYNMGRLPRKPRYDPFDGLGEIEQAAEEDRISGTLRDSLIEQFEDFIGPENM